MKCVTGARSTPVLAEFVLVQFGPREDEAQLPAPEGALDHLQCVDADLGVAVRVAGMEVLWAVIVVLHRDHDPKETTDRGHGAHPPCRSGGHAYPGPAMRGTFGQPLRCWRLR